MKNPFFLLLSTAALALAVSPAAHAVVFDFESTPATYNSGTTAAEPGTFTGLAITTNGLTLTLSRQNGDRFDIVDNTTGNQTGKPASWGSHSLDPFFDYDTSTPTVNNGFIANFSQALGAFSMQFGDYAFPDNDTLTLQAFSGLNGTGTLLATTTVAQTAAFTGFDTASVASGVGIRSVVWSSTSPEGYFNSLFYDNFQATVVPEPGTTALILGAGLTMVVIVRARRRSLAAK